MALADRAGMRFLFLSLLLVNACAGLGQSLTVGVVGGARLTDDLTGNATSESKRYAIGPEVELGLPFGLAVEVDALYRREGYSSVTNYVVESTANERANSWEFPILVKYKTAFPVVKPFVEAGYAPRVIKGTINSSCSPASLCGGSTQSQLGTNWQTSHGLVLGGGVQVGIGRLRLSPEVRYTRWNNAAINVITNFSFQSTQNQVDALVGLGWKMR